MNQKTINSFVLPFIMASLTPPTGDFVFGRLINPNATFSAYTQITIDTFETAVKKQRKSFSAASTNSLT